MDASGSRGERVAGGLVINAISQRKKWLDQIRKISTGEGFGGKRSELSTGYEWWRCRDLNPGHCGYEPHALTD